MIGQLSTLYFQTYQLAFKLAKQAEVAFYFEKGIKDTIPTIVQPNYWDSLHNGLLAGESLMLDLHRMDQTYMQQNKRKLEIQKTISLAQLNPQTLISLKNTGSCIFEIIEQDFDDDYPGHYCRQIKTISLTFPAILGPYQNIHATLTQTSNKTLLKESEEGVKYLLLPKKESVIIPDSIKSDVMSNQQIALSQGINDSGMFVMDFNDQRYLPFEGTGAVSNWQLDMPLESNDIDFSSISDVIIQLNYTAIPGSNIFKEIVKEARNSQGFNRNVRLNVAQDFSSQWTSFINGSNELTFQIKQNQLCRYFNKYKITNLCLQFTLMPNAETFKGENFNLNIADQSINLIFNKGPNKGVISAMCNNSAINHAIDKDLVLSSNGGANKWFNSNNVQNLMIVVKYEVSNTT